MSNNPRYFDEDDEETIEDRAARLDEDEAARRLGFEGVPPEDWSEEMRRATEKLKQDRAE